MGFAIAAILMVLVLCVNGAAKLAENKLFSQKALSARKKRKNDMENRASFCSAKHMNLYYGTFQALKDVNLTDGRTRRSRLSSGRPAAGNPPS